jgi:hypothetical protein
MDLKRLKYYYVRWVAMVTEFENYIKEKDLKTNFPHFTVD